MEDDEPLTALCGLGRSQIDGETPKKGANLAKEAKRAASVKTADVFVDTGSS